MPPAHKAQATTELFFIFSEIILVILASFIIYEKISSISEDRIFLKKFYVRDIALLLDTIQGMPGNVLYFYTNPQPPQKDEEDVLSKLSFNLSQTLIEVESDKYPVAVHLSAPASVEQARELRITKNGNMILFQKQEAKLVFNPNMIPCPDIKTVITGPILLDPGHGYNEQTDQGGQGFVGKHGKESEIVRTIAQELAGSLALHQFSVKTTRALDIEDARTINERKTKIASTGLLISFHANDNKNTNVLKAYINYNSPNYEKSVKLACLVLNQLSTQFPLATHGTSIIPINPAQLDENNPKHILDSEGIGAQFEFGSVENDQSYLLRSKEIASAITRALQEYNS